MIQKAAFAGEAAQAAPARAERVAKNEAKNEA